MRYNLMPSFAKPNDSNTGVSFTSPLQSLKKIYGKVKAHEVLLQCMYIVKIEDIFNNGPNIPWFKDPSLGYLVTDANISFGSSEAENYHAGALPAGYLTVKTGDDTDMTFIETGAGDIFKSYRACHELAFNKDGTVNEPRKYAFKLTVALINHKHPDRPPPVTRSWLVAVKSGSAEASSAGRSEIVKEQITFQKVRPLIFER